jgi:uncharacterized protein (TIGR02996 family)
MTTLDAIRAEILAHPADDFPRRAYADWLDDSGMTNTASWVRAMLDDPSLFMTYTDRERGMWFGEIVFITPPLPGGGKVTVRRGFIESVSLKLADFMSHEWVPPLLLEHPITRIVLSDRDPTTSEKEIDAHDERIGWYCRDYDADADDIPIELFYLLAAGRLKKGRWRLYNTIQDALDDLSQACLAFAGAQKQMP